MKNRDIDKNSPLFTVIIPCKDRAEYLYHTLQTCIMQDYDHLEVIVADDGSSDFTRDVVEDAARRDGRIRYISQGRGIGMRDNFESVLREAKPGFVIALGGDDGLLPGGITGMADTIRETKMELLAWPAPLFTYPKVRGENGQLAIYNKKKSKIVKSCDFLKRQVDSLHYISDIESPMFYVKGVASTRLIDRVRRRSKDNRFYSCSTPDGYSGIVLAGEVERYAFSAKPFSIYGLSPTSQGLAYLSNDSEAKKTSEAFYAKAVEVPMHHELSTQPYSPLITLMTVDYLLRARDLPGWPGSLPPIDYQRVLKNGLKELAHGLYGDDRICRELSILNNVAELHGLGNYFRRIVDSSYRKHKKLPLVGSGFSPSTFYFDAEVFDIHNILDASYVAKYFYQFYSKITPSFIIRTAVDSIKYRLQSMKKGNHFPSASDWDKSAIK